MDAKPIIVADNDSEKLKKSFGKFLRTMRIISAILIVLGILFCSGRFFYGRFFGTIC